MLIIERHYLILSSYFVTMWVGRQAGGQVGRWVVLTYHDLQLLHVLTKGFILDVAGVLGLPMPKGKKSRTEHI